VSLSPQALNKSAAATAADAARPRYTGRLSPGDVFLVVLMVCSLEVVFRDMTSQRRRLVPRFRCGFVAENLRKRCALGALTRHRPEGWVEPRQRPVLGPSLGCGATSARADRSRSPVTWGWSQSSRCSAGAACSAASLGFGSRWDRGSPRLSVHRRRRGISVDVAGGRVIDCCAVRTVRIGPRILV
jgi:hypothetical protein